MYLKNPEIAAISSPENHIRKMLDFEMALAKVQGQLGIIPTEASNKIENKLKNLIISPIALEEGTLKNGIPTISLLEIAKKSLPESAKDYLHFGATSQDVMDTATVLVMKEAIIFLEKNLFELVENLGLLIENQGNIPMIGRTRTQQAVPILAGQKLANWCLPLLRQVDRLREIKQYLLALQLGGAAGNLAAMGTDGAQISTKLAQELGLQNTLPWHNQRDNFAEFASWLAITSGVLGKMAADILVLSQTEIGEITENATGGKSSTMPHKNNPVLSEAMVALARKNAVLVSIQMQSLIHNNERDGATWAMEWDNLPEMIANTGTALIHAKNISKSLKINELATNRNLNFTNGLIYSEAATFILANRIPKNEAKALVQKACEIVVAEQRNFIEVMQELTQHLSINWAEELQIEKHLGITNQIISEVLFKIRALGKRS